MTTHRIAVVVGLTVMLSAGSAMAAMIKVDFDFDGRDGPTQSGWLGINATNNRYASGTQLSGPGDGLPAGVEAGWDTGASDRNRTPSDNNMPGSTAGGDLGVLDGIDYQNLLRDYVSLDGLEANPSFVVKGLPASPYKVSVIGGDPNYGTQYAPYDFGVNGTDYSHPGYPGPSGGGSAAEVDSITTLAQNPNHPTEWSITVTVDVTLGAGEDLNIYRGAAVTSGDQVRLAGIRIEQVPEPATLSLLALGGLALARRRRRK